MQRVTADEQRPDGGGGGYRLLMERVTDHAVLFLDTQGYVAAWDAGAERLLGYREDEIRGEHFCRLFFRPEEVRRGEPEYELHAAATRGRAAGERWYVRRDGTALWCDGITAALRDRGGRLCAFAKVLRDLTARKVLGRPPGQRQG